MVLKKAKKKIIHTFLHFTMILLCLRFLNNQPLYVFLKKLQVFFTIFECKNVFQYKYVSRTFFLPLSLNHFVYLITNASLCILQKWIFLENRIKNKRYCPETLSDFLHALCFLFLKRQILINMYVADLLLNSLFMNAVYVYVFNTNNIVEKYLAIRRVCYNTTRAEILVNYTRIFK